ncbi:MAG: zinc-ribbon domain-containing protein [Clostridia bacterium]|nr:zinc-ribbon domain-containing protein [Clostridia bacterium]
MKCPFCGSELEQGAGFCPACGTIISLDNEFVSPTHPSSVPPLAKPEPPAQAAPAEEPLPEAPAAPEVPDVPEMPDVPEEAPQPAPEMEPLNGMPAYVSPTFEAYEPAQTVGAEDAPYDPETDDDDPFRELHPDLEDAPPAAPAPVVIPPEAKISDTQPVAIEGDIPVYEPTEEIVLPEDAPDAAQAEEADDLDDMYVTGGKGKKGKVAALLVVLLLAAAAVGAWYYMKTENPFFRPSTEPSAIIVDSTDPTTEPTTEPAAEPTEKATEKPDDEAGKNGGKKGCGGTAVGILPVALLAAAASAGFVFKRKEN